MKLLLHPEAARQIETLAANVKGSMIFYGPTQIGKRSAAVQFAKKLNCTCHNQNTCHNCRLIDHHNYPDLITIIPDEKSIGIAQIQALQQSLSLSRYNPDGYRVIIVDAAETLTTEAQNCFLKLLEEPPPGTVIILIASELSALLPTVISRCSSLYFAEFTSDQVVTHLESELSLDRVTATDLSKLASHRIGLAITLSTDPALYQIYAQAASDADHIVQTRPFERLVLASKLSQSPDTLAIVLNLLATRLSSVLRQTPPDKLAQLVTVNRLKALERFYLYQNTNVNLRAALEGLMLEMG